MPIHAVEKCCREQLPKDMNECAHMIYGGVVVVATAYSLTAPSKKH
jgi:hypothetical protein